MNKRYVKRIDKYVSEVGFGAWQLGGTGTWGNMSKEEGIALVKEAVNSGVTFFDTAPGYASGNSELILGEALEGIREQVVINTKVGHAPDGSWEFDREGITRSINRSLEKLRTTYLDSVILHNPERYILEGKSDLTEVLDEFKHKGIIKGYGVSVDSLEELNIVLENLDVDTIEVMFNIVHQETKYAFDEIHKRGILLIIKVPLDSGWLTGKYDETSVFDGIRSRWSKETIEIRSSIVKRVKEIVGSEDLVLPALRFILSFDAVSTVIPGTKNIKQLHSNIKASDEVLEEGIKTQLEDLYDTYIKDVDTPW
jgi:aryl-alcohol dehydrogenase-like predicted oxidoreductase